MLRFRLYLPVVTVGVLVICTVWIWLLVAAATPPGVLTVAVLDVGQGDAIYIESPSGIQVLVDGGPDGSVLSELAAVMPTGDHSIDAVIETHPDADHIGGLVDVADRYSVGIFLSPGMPKKTATYLTLRGSIASYQVPELVARRGMVLDLGGGAVLSIMFPNTDVSSLPASKSNDGGVVARLVYGSTSFLLTADVSEKVEARLVSLEGTGLASTVLKVGHHGSKYSNSAAFLAMVKPVFAAVSVGARNRYGHPTDEALSRLADVGARILRTDQDGRIMFISNGIELVRH